MKLTNTDRWLAKWLAAISGVGVLLAAGAAQAVTFTETNDAGENLTDAVSVSSNQTTALASISGFLNGDADLFKIFLTGGQTFSATTSNSETAQIPIDQALGIDTDLLVDPKLFLFDTAGNGVYANDDLFGSTQSTLVSGPGGFSPTESGAYFLGISGTGLEAFSAGGQIFPSDPFDQIVGPTGAGGGSSLTGFEGDRANSFGRYSIALTGAQTLANVQQPAKVPAPSMVLGLLALGAKTLTSKRKKSGNINDESIEN